MAGKYGYDITRTSVLDRVAFWFEYEGGRRERHGAVSITKPRIGISPPTVQSQKVYTDLPTFTAAMRELLDLDE